MLSLEKFYGPYNINRLFENENSPGMNICVFTPKLKYIIRHYKYTRLDLAGYRLYGYTDIDSRSNVRFTAFNDTNDKYIANIGALPIKNILI